MSSQGTLSAKFQIKMQLWRVIAPVPPTPLLPAIFSFSHTQGHHAKFKRSPSLGATEGLNLGPATAARVRRRGSRGSPGPATDGQARPRWVTWTRRIHLPFCQKLPDEEKKVPLKSHATATRGGVGSGGRRQRQRAGGRGAERAAAVPRRPPRLKLRSLKWLIRARPARAAATAANKAVRALPPPPPRSPAPHPPRPTARGCGGRGLDPRPGGGAGRTPPG